jgi:hypothetical protein
MVTKSHVTWVAQWFLLTLGWHLPATLANLSVASMPQWWTRHIVTLPALAIHPSAVWNGDFGGVFGASVAFSLPTLLFYLTLPPLLVVIVQEYRSRGSRPAHLSRPMALASLASWPFLPLITFAFGCLPAIDAQWQLASGRRFGFRVAEKGSRRSLPVASSTGHDIPIAPVLDSATASDG